MFEKKKESENPFEFKDRGFGFGEMEFLDGSCLLCQKPIMMKASVAWNDAKHTGGSTPIMVRANSVKLCEDCRAKVKEKLGIL